MTNKQKGTQTMAKKQKKSSQGKPLEKLALANSILSLIRVALDILLMIIKRMDE